MDRCRTVMGEERDYHCELEEGHDYPCSWYLVDPIVITMSRSEALWLRSFLFKHIAAVGAATYPTNITTLIDKAFDPTFKG